MYRAGRQRDLRVMTARPREDLRLLCSSLACCCGIALQCWRILGFQHPTHQHCWGYQSPHFHPARQTRSAKSEQSYIGDRCRRENVAEVLADSESELDAERSFPGACCPTADAVLNDDSRLPIGGPHMDDAVLNGDSRLPILHG